MFFLHRDPGPCPVCGAVHSACTTSPATMTAVLLPERDRAVAAAAAPLLAEQLQAGLPVGNFTTGTYRGKGGRR